MEKRVNMVGNIVDRGENSPIPTVFSKDLYCRHIKTRAYLGKGLSHFNRLGQIMSVSDAFPQWK